MTFPMLPSMAVGVAIAVLPCVVQGDDSPEAQPGEAEELLDLDRGTLVIPTQAVFEDQIAPVWGATVGEMVHFQFSHPVQIVPLSVRLIYTPGTLEPVSAEQTKGELIELGPGEVKEGEYGVGYFSVYAKAQLEGYTEPRIEFEMSNGEKLFFHYGIQILPHEKYQKPLMGRILEVSATGQSDAAHKGTVWVVLGSETGNGDSASFWFQIKPDMANSEAMLETVLTAVALNARIKLVYGEELSARSVTLIAPQE